MGGGHILYLDHNFLCFIHHAIPWLFTLQIFYHHALFLVIITALMLIITISLRDYHSSISGLSQLYNWFISALWLGYHSSITGLSQLYNRLITALSQGCNFCTVLSQVTHSLPQRVCIYCNAVEHHYQNFMYSSLTTHDINKGHQLC